MKSVLIRKTALTVVLPLALILSGLQATPEQDTVNKIEDHLVPVDLRMDKDRRTILEKHLVVTPASYGRMVIKPAFDPESVVSVYSIKLDNSETFYVTLTKASENLSQAVLDGRTTSIVGERNRVRRVDAEISKSAADAVRDVLRRMLSQTRPYSDVVRPPSDQTEIEVSLDEPNGASLNGELPVRGGNCISGLETLGKLLVKYCKAEPNYREKLAKNIENDARHLLAKVEQGCN